MSPAVDLTGQRIGHWTVLEIATGHKGETYWRCQCDCGAIHDVKGSDMKTGRSLSCHKCGTGFIDLTGLRFGRWTVLCRSEKRDRTDRGTYWRCQCDCGAIHDVRSGNLMRGTSKGCRDCANRRRKA